MRTIAFWLSLLLVFVIPWENIIDIDSLGTLSRVTGLLVAAFWMVTVVVTGRFRELRLFHGVVFLFVLWKIASVFWSVNVEDSVTSLQTNFQLFGFVLILWDLYTTPAALKAGLQAYVLGAFVSIASIVKNQLAGTTFLYQRYSATGFHVDDIGVILALGIPVAWYLATSESHSRMTRVLKLVNYAYIPAALLGIALTGTRTALVAALPALLYGLGSLTRLKFAGRALIFVVLLAALFILQSYVPQTSFERLSTTGSSITDGDLNGRVDIWRYGLAAFAERPLLGFGSGAFRSAIEEGRVAHNTFLSVLVEVGMIGFVLFGIIVVIAFRQAIRQPTWEARFWLSVLMVWFLGSFALTWEPRKQTWLFLSLAVANASLFDRRDAFHRRLELPHTEIVKANWSRPTADASLAEGGINKAGLTPKGRVSRSPWQNSEQPDVHVNAPVDSHKAPLIGKRR